MPRKKYNDQEQMVFYIKKTYFLYNIEHDPSEKYDIAKNNKDIIDMLQKLSSDHIQSVPRTPSKYDDILPFYLSAYDEYNKK